MKLYALRKQIDELMKQREGEDMQQYADRIHEDAPRMPYAELPYTLQQAVRERFTPDRLEAFLRELYVTKDFEDALKTMTQAEKDKLPSPAENYKSFETITAGINPDDLLSVLRQTRNIAIYTVEYEGEQLAPVLYGNFATQAFESVLNKKGIAPRPKAATLVSAGFYQKVISDKQYQHALTTKKNPSAYIALMIPDFFESLDFKDGYMTFNKETESIIKKYSKGKYEDLKELDLPLLQQIYTASANAHLKHDENTITVSIPAFFREMNIDTHSGKASDFMRKLMSFQNCIGIMQDTQEVLSLFVLIRTDLQKQEMTFAVPYMIRLLDLLEKKNHIARSTKKGELIDYEQPYHNTLVHSAIASERNKPAVELVYLMTTGLLQRGNVPDAETYRRSGTKASNLDRITYSVKFKTLLNDAPILRGRIHDYSTQADKNRALKRAFEKAYQLITSKTDAALYFKNLHFQAVIPTMTTLEGVLTFTHEGRNTDYKPHL